MSELDEMLENRLKKFKGDDENSDSVMFYRLREKIDLLEDHLDTLKTNY